MNTIKEKIDPRHLLVEKVFGSVNDAEINELTNEYGENIERGMDTLLSRERAVLRARCGYDGGTPITFRAIGERYNISPEYVRQIEIQALRLLRSPTIRKGDFSTNPPPEYEGFVRWKGEGSSQSHSYAESNTVGVGRGGALSVSATLHKEIGEPEYYQFAFDPKKSVIAISGSDTPDKGTCKVQHTSPGTYQTFALSFARYWGIDISYSRRYQATVQDGVIHVDLTTDELYSRKHYRRWEED